MNETDTLINHIETWTQDVLIDELKMAAWVAACQSTNNAHKEAVIDELLGESKAGKSGQVLTGKSGTVTWEWHDKDWLEAHDRSKY